MVPPPSESLETVGFSYFSKGDGGRKVLTHLPRIIKNRWIVLVFEGGGVGGWGGGSASSTPQNH